MQRGDDGKVITHLGIVKNAFGRANVVAIQRRERVGRQVLHATVGQHLKGLLDHRHVVFGQGAGVGSRVGQRFVALVQALGNRECGFGREAKLAVGLSLQRGQVKQQGRDLGGGLAFFGDRGFLAAHGLGNGLRLAGVPDPVGLEFGVRLFIARSSVGG